MCCSLIFANGAIALLLMVQEMHVELLSFYCCVLVEYKKENALCLKHE